MELDSHKTKIEISMLGGFSIKIGDNTIDDCMNNSKKIWILLEYLIVHRKNEISQSDLVQLLWNGEKVEQPLNSIKVLLYRSRKVLEMLNVPYAKDLIVQMRGTCRWNPIYECDVDCEKFEALCKEAEKTEDIEQKINYYYKGIDLYKGKFLPNYGKSQWVIALQNYYQSCYEKALFELLSILRSHQKYEQCVDLCHQALKLEYWSEEIHCHLLFSLIKMGRNEEALKHYNNIIHLLYHQIGKKTPERLILLYEEIIKNIEHEEMDLDTIRSHLKEDEIKKGPFLCNFEVFKYIYRLEARHIVRRNTEAYLCLMSIKDKKERPQKTKNQTQSMTQLLSIMNHLLRKGDVISRYSQCQYVLLLSSLTYQNAAFVMERLSKAFQKKVKDPFIVLEYKLRPVESIEEGT